MFVILGAAGRVGFATSSALRQANLPVRAVLRDAGKAEPLRDIGCEIAIADFLDVPALTKAFHNADAVQLIVPPSPQAEDGAGEIRKTIDSLVTALEQAKPKHILAISDYGAHVAQDIGMPTLFGEFEQRLRQVPGHKIIVRSAEHMQNLGRSIPIAIESGTLPSFRDPVDEPFPTISAPDLGKIAADILQHPIGAKEVEIYHAEGPRRYAPNDVAKALSELLDRSINAEAVPHSQWSGIFESIMSPSNAMLLVKTNEAANERDLVDVEQGVGEVRYGSAELIDALRTMIP